MAIPSKAEIKKKELDLQKLLKPLENPETGKQKHKALINMVRSAIRQCWMKSNNKLAYLEMGRYPDLDPSTLTKWKVDCELCHRAFKLPEIQIDHISDNNKFTKIEDFGSYFTSILDVEFKDLQRVCTTCHSIKTHLHGNGFTSTKAATVDKIVLFILKVFDKAEVNRVLSLLEITPASNGVKRRAQYVKWLTDLQLTESEYYSLYESCNYLLTLEKKYKKAKRFKLSNVDLMHIVRWRSFWLGGGIEPKTTLKVLHLNNNGEIKLNTFKIVRNNGKVEECMGDKVYTDKGAYLIERKGNVVYTIPKSDCKCILPQKEK